MELIKKYHEERERKLLLKNPEEDSFSGNDIMQYTEKKGGKGEGAFSHILLLCKKVLPVEVVAEICKEIIG